MILNFVLLAFDPQFEAEGLNKDVLTPKWGWDAVSSVSVMMVSFGYQVNCIPILSEMRTKTIDEY